MSYQLAMAPLDFMRITAGYKSPGYTKWFQNTHKIAGVIHYGTDMADKTRSKKAIRAPFDMKIAKVGFDTLFGNVIVATSVLPVDIHNGPKKGRRRLAIRMFHLASTKVKAGQVVKRGTIIGTYGGTGRYGGADHLHVELDTDVKYPAYALGISSHSNIIKRGTVDSTVNVMDVFKIFPGQELYATYSSSMGPDDTSTLTSAQRYIVARKAL